MLHPRPCLTEEAAGPHLDTVAAPAPSLGGARDVLLQLGLQLGQIQEHVPRLAHHRRGPRQGTLGPDQLCGVQQVAAAVTLVPSGVLQGCRWSCQVQGRQSTRVLGSSMCQSCHRHAQAGMEYAHALLHLSSSRPASTFNQSLRAVQGESSTGSEQGATAFVLILAAFQSQASLTPAGPLNMSDCSPVGPKQHVAARAASIPRKQPVQT